MAGGVLRDQELFKGLFPDEMPLIETEDLVLFLNPTFQVIIRRHERKG